MLRAQVGGEAGGVVAEHPVDLLAAGLGDGGDGRPHLTFPGLAGEHAGHFGLGGKQRRGVGVADHLLQIQRRGVIGRAVEHGLVQAGFAIALAQLAEQHLPGLGHQLWIGFDAQLRMGSQLLGIKRPQGRRQPLPESWRVPGALRFGVGQGLGEERRVGFFRPRQHQVSLELRVGRRRPPGALGAVRRQLDQRLEVGLEGGRRRVAQQALIGLDVTRPQRGQQRLVLVQAETLIPRGAVGGAVIQTREFAHQFVQRLQLRVARDRLL
ncbi:hypothetical protein D9M71_237620 [compost metagenome]